MTERAEVEVFESRPSPLIRVASATGRVNWGEGRWYLSTTSKREEGKKRITNAYQSAREMIVDSN